MKSASIELLIRAILATRASPQDIGAAHENQRAPHPSLWCNTLLADFGNCFEPLSVEGIAPLLFLGIGVRLQGFLALLIISLLVGILGGISPAEIAEILLIPLVYSLPRQTGRSPVLAFGW